MGRINFDIRRLALGNFAKSPEYISQNCGESCVASTCHGARAALSAFAALIVEGERPGLKSEVKAARLTLNRSLVVVRREPSRTLADVQLKCRVYRELETILPEYDGKVRAFAHDLIADMIHLPEGNQTSTSSGVHNGAADRPS